MRTLVSASIPLVLCFILTSFTRKPPLPVLQASYIYGYNNSLVIAQVTNASKDQIAHTSFETITDKGYWDYLGNTFSPGRTGNLYYVLSSGNIQRTGLLRGKYIVSYWASGSAAVAGTNFTSISQYNGTTAAGKVINGWTYYETVFSLSADNSNITLSGSVNIDELRLYPINAQMTTYTYDPLVGKTSETDANNVTTFYEYDTFNRLKLVKDQYGNIIKQNVYHYKGQ